MDVLTTTDVQLLSLAQATLKDIGKRAAATAWDAPSPHDGADCGRLAEAADAAEGAIFNVLNVANSYLQDGAAQEFFALEDQRRETREAEEAVTA